MMSSLTAPKPANPLSERERNSRIVDPCIMVIFGATGDLTARKLLPALYNLAHDGELPGRFACVGFARRPKDHGQFREEMRQGVQRHTRLGAVDDVIWDNFKDNLYYHRSEFDDDGGYERLALLLDDLDKQLGTQGNRLYYLSTPPKHFPTIVAMLSKHKLLYPHTEKQRWTRVIIEKPFGHDLASAEELQEQLCRHLDEQQLWRIDHYLGKETVQNLLIFRFTNPIFEEMWNNRHIDHVQITVSEEMGIGTRGHLFEEAGILRDIVQNHMMQLLSLVAMEPPNDMSAASIRDEKVKVMRAIRPFTSAELDEKVVRGQYGPGLVLGETVCGYREEADVSADSTVETFAALELTIDNWRWVGVPFFLRCGKRLAKRATEIAIQFKNPPAFIQRDKGECTKPNVLVMRIQPDEGISLKFNCKVPGMREQLHPVKMNFLYGSFFGAAPPEAYEKLICDCMAGDKTLFASYDEVISSWRLLTTILEHWQRQPAPAFPNYPSGSWGPDEAEQLIERAGRQWRLL